VDICSGTENIRILGHHGWMDGCKIEPKKISLILDASDKM
jgi:hypothetical protein